jgi:arsenate reductase
MKRFYYLSSCSTCIRILKELNLPSHFELVDIKKTNIDQETLDFLQSKTGSFEALFSKKAMKYKSLGLNQKNLSEIDFKKLILEEYTFLKRPILIDEQSVFVGNLADVVSKAKAHLSN